MIHFKSIQVGLLATAALGISTNAVADTVDFTDNGGFTTSSLTEGIVTVTGSNDIEVTDNIGLSVVGGLADVILDPGETMSFAFTTPVTDVVIGTYQAFDTDGNGLGLNATFEGFAPDGTITTVVAQFDGSLPIDVSGILGVASMSSFNITMNFDSIQIASITFQEVGGVPVLSCSGFDSPFSGPLSIRKKAKGAIPAKLSLTDSGGLGVTDLDVTAPPVVNVEFNGVVFGNGDTDDAALESVGKSNEGNAFAYNNDNQRWEYRLGTKQFSEAGTYLVTVKSGDAAEYTIDAPGGQCTQTFTRQP